MASQHILIIDDEANQRLMLEEALRSLEDQCAIATATTGAEALELVLDNEPDLIITDYHMPVMTGLDIIAQIRARGLTSRIILITAYSSPELYDAAQRLKIDYYLTKPVPIPLLRQLASAALNRSNSLIE